VEAPPPRLTLVYLRAGAGIAAPDVLAGATDNRQEFENVFSVYQWLLVGVTCIVFALVLYCIVRFRRRDSGFSRSRHKSPRAESLYVLALAVIAAGLVTITFKAEARTDRVVRTGSIAVAVTAFQWGWRFDYPDARVSILGDDRRPPTLVLPAGESVTFSLVSRDVIHALWIPEARFKRDAFPKRVSHFTLLLDREGSFEGRCAEFCGLRHPDMTFRVLVVPRARFDAELRAAAGQP
jgi:cytochrome c oxidase subunit 2